MEERTEIVSHTGPEAAEGRQSIQRSGDREMLFGQEGRYGQTQYRSLAGERARGDEPLQMPHASMESESGTAPFDIMEERRRFGEWAETLEEPYRSILRYYNETTEYVASDQLRGAPFGYSPGKDAILYNPSHPRFRDFDFKTVNTHELAHRFDTLSGTPSWEDVNFSSGLTEAAEYVIREQGTVERFLAENEASPFLSDIMSALGLNDRFLTAGHPADYWEKVGTRSSETFANLFSIVSSGNDREYDWLSKWAPRLIQAFENKVGGL